MHTVNPSQLSPGDIVGDHVIEARLGAGGFGEVYLARERSPQRRVALKFVRPELAVDPDFVRRFEREVDAMAAVEHPNVVPIYSHRVEQGRRYFSMRYVPGGSLAALLEEREPALGEVLDVLAGVAEGLDCCHARGIVHRDLKPGNILVDEGRGLLADFGVALVEDLSTLTGPGARVGTSAYMAPETVLGARATPASDLWALGAIAYRVATGRFPRGHSQPADTAPIPPSRSDERLGPDVDRVLLRALAFDPADRHPDARTFVSELRAALSPAPRRVPRRAWKVGGAAVLVTPLMAYAIAALPDRAASSANCNPSYVGACLPVEGPDYDCKGGGGDGPRFVDRTIKVVGRDVYDLDGNGDGVAC